MRICIDSNCFAKLIDHASGELYDAKKQSISYSKERLDYFISSNRPQIILPTLIYCELLMISTVEDKFLDEYLASNAEFISAAYDVRAASIHAQIEKPLVQKNNKKAGRDENMNRLKFDRQILAIAKKFSVDYVITSDAGMVKDALRYGIQTKCVSTMDLPPDIKQPSLDLVVNNLSNIVGTSPV